MTSRRFSSPWDIEEHNRSCFVVRDNNGQALAHVYFETEPAGAQPPSCSRAMRQGGLRQISQSCPNRCGGSSARYQRPSLGCVHSAMLQVANPVARGAFHHAPIASGRHRAPAPRQHGGGWPCDKLVSDLIQAFVEIDRRLNELERRAGAAPSGK